MTRALPCAAAVIASCVAAAPATAGDVVINEIHFEPPDHTVPEEFVELCNAGDEAVDLSGWFFSDGIAYEFPEGTAIEPGGTIVVAQDPETLAADFHVTDVLGPFDGRLENDGERIVLRDAAGGIEDEVQYALHFPWPIAPTGHGSSMELIHPSLDNALGGSWRASGFTDDLPGERIYLFRAEEEWSYRRGLSEASDPPSAWRLPDFVEDGSWRVGRTSIGYGDSDDNTVLDDMRNSYTSVYLRRMFFVQEDGELPRLLKLGVYIDDGCIVWINGVEVARLYAREGEQPFDATAGASHEAGWTDLLLQNPASFLVPGGNVVAIHAFNRSRGSSDFSIDAELYVPGSQDIGTDFFGFPTPGARNSVYAENAPPHVPRVAHFPQQPPQDGPIFVTAEVTDPQGVASVELRYQLVFPGDYIPAFLPLPHATLLARPDTPRPPNPAFEDPASWMALPMVDDGTGADQVADDGLYTAMIPGQPNRTLVRYRIAATDAAGASVIVPYRDDPSLDFACFVYDGVPPYVASRRSVHPEGPGHVYPVEAMTSLAVYFLITREEDITEAIAADPSLQIPQGTQARFAFNWEGAFVYEGIVYDHVRYRLRGANGRYQVPSGNPSNVTGKRHWRIRFNKGHYLRARDRFGNLHPTRWSVLNTGRMFGNRLDGNWGLGDQVNDIIWNAYGVPAAFGHAFHWRVVDGPEEAPASAYGQYLGDFWGIARAFENYDVRFLEAHGLPRGNLYKLVNQTKNALEQLRYQAPYAVSDGSDHDNIEGNLRPERPDSWLLTYVNYDQWYRYHAVVQALRHYDYWPDANKNAAWYFEPVYTPENHDLGRMWTFPFDADATWGPTWNEGRDRPYEAIFGGSGKPAFQKAYRNAIREVRDLLWQRDQLEQVIRQTAAFMDDLEEPDIDRWRDAPAQAGRQYFPAANQRTLEGKIQDMLRFAFTGGSWPGGSVGAGGRARFLDSFADAPYRRQLPEKPDVTYTGPPGFPIDALTFRTSPFSDPQGSGTFKALAWRIAEISDIPDAGSIPLSDPIWRAEPVKLEITAAWESGALETFDPDIAIPSTVVEPGRHYRVRARMMDDTDLWSHWSDPVEFRAGEPLSNTPQQDFLRITEIMYHPRGDSGFEFIELLNTGSAPLDLRDVHFRRGISFSFDDGDVNVLDPGAYAVLVKNRRVFATRYDAADLPIAGEFAGTLSNGGEAIELVHGRSQVILSFRYSDAWYPSTDGDGYSLVLDDPATPPDAFGTAWAWRPGLVLHGSPGWDDAAGPAGLQLPGDIQQDGRLDISDAIVFFTYLFGGQPARLPCGDGTSVDPANIRLLDGNGDAAIDLADGIFVLNYLFGGGPPPMGGTACMRIAGCPDACAP